jgi:hypothetical protein
MKTIRLNPTWEWAAGILLAVVEHGETPEARAEAKYELMKLARNHDELLRKHTDYFEPKEVEIGAKTD